MFQLQKEPFYKLFIPPWKRNVSYIVSIAEEAKEIQTVNQTIISYRVNHNSRISFQTK